MKQNKQKGSTEYWILFFVICMIISFLQVVQDNDIKRLEKYDSCLTQAITVNPDPNDTTERTLKLTECMNK